MPTPDGVPCRWCGQPIFWDEICWVHDNGFADCDLTISGGTPIGAVEGATVVLDPTIKVEGPNAGRHAEPVPPWD